MKFFKIKNYEKYQGSRSGDGKPWIKLYKKLRHDWAYGQLHDSHKTAFIHLLLTADEVSNQFPCDSRALRKQLVLNSYVKIEVFEKVGLIELIVDPSETEKPPRIDKNRVYKQKRIDKRERIKTSLNIYHDLFLEKFKTKPLILAKHGPMMAHLEKKMGRDEIIDLVQQYFKSDDKFIIDSGFTIDVFGSQINKLIVSRTVKSQQPTNGNGRRPSPEHEARMDEIERKAIENDKKNRV